MSPKGVATLIRGRVPAPSKLFTSCNRRRGAARRWSLGCAGWPTRTTPPRATPRGGRRPPPPGGAGTPTGCRRSELRRGTAAETASRPAQKGRLMNGWQIPEGHKRGPSVGEPKGEGPLLLLPGGVELKHLHPHGDLQDAAQGQGAWDPPPAAPVPLCRLDAGVRAGSHLHHQHGDVDVGAPRVHVARREGPREDQGEPVDERALHVLLLREGDAHPASRWEGAPRGEPEVVQPPLHLHSQSAAPISRRGRKEGACLCGKGGGPLAGPVITFRTRGP